MSKKIRKTIIGVAVLFFTYSYGQKDTIDSHFLERNINLFKASVLSKSNKQKEEVKRLKSQGYKEFIEDGINSKQLIGADENGRPQYYTTLNAGAAKMTKANLLYVSTPQRMAITGSGMVIGQWDFSKPRIFHELLTGKITYPSTENQTVSRHSTNIAGTIVGNNGDINAKGIAYDATMKAYDWVNDIAEMTNEAYSSANSNGILVANNSYGYDPMYIQTQDFGKYNATAKSWDELMYLKPYFQIVKAAGNARELDPTIVPQVTASKGFDLLEGAGIAKNVLVIGSAKKNTNMTSDESYEVSNFSSYGPTDDGRIKPDMVAPGEEMYSSIETHNSAYGLYKGTSSATAVVSGIIALLQQYYKSVSPNSSYMQSSTVRALLAHTANDKGDIGPDYIYGWGLIDADRAVKAIYNNIEGTTNNEKKTTLIKELTLAQGSQYELYVVPYNTNELLSATIAWTDPGGTNTPANKDLINDLDLRIVKINANGTEAPYYPWKLQGLSSMTDVDTNNNAATRITTNNVDNIERVDIDANQLQKVTYKVIVSTKSKTVPLLPNGTQNFSIVISNVDFCYMDDLKTLVSPTNDIDASTVQKVIKAKQIVASNIVKSSAQNVEYIASRDIRLLPGFQSELGSGFRAYITPCFDTTSNMAYRAQVRTNQSENTPTEIVSKELVSIYPNPAKEEVNVKFSIKNNESKIKISVYDALGKLMISNESSEYFPKGEFFKTINTSKLTTGIYIVVVETNNYKESKKLIIK